MTVSSAVSPQTARHATLEGIVSLLRSQQPRKVDVVAPAAAIRAHAGNLILNRTVPQITADGVTMSAGSYQPTAVFDEGVADKLGIPVAYLRRMREADLPSLYDHNLNGWLERDDRSFLVRCLLGHLCCHALDVSPESYGQLAAGWFRGRGPSPAGLRASPVTVCQAAAGTRALVM